MTDNESEVVIAEFGQNAREVVRVSLASFKGTQTVNVWRFYRDAGGNLRPSKSGIVLGLRHLPTLAAGLAQALQTARDLGRLRDG